MNRILVAATAFLSTVAIGRTPDLDISLLFAENVVVGNVCPMGRDEIKRYQAVGVKVGDEPIWVRTEWQEQIPKNCIRAVVSWAHLGSNKFVTTSPVLGIFPVSTITTKQIGERRSAIRLNARSYLRRASCSSEMTAMLKGLSGEDGQRHVTWLSASPPNNDVDILCLISKLNSQDPIVITSFPTPYAHWEGIYHAGSMRLGELLNHLLPHVLGVNIQNEPEPQSSEARARAERLVETWAYWAACKAKDELCLAAAAMEPP